MRICVLLRTHHTQRHTPLFQLLLEHQITGPEVKGKRSMHQNFQEEYDTVVLTHTRAGECTQTHTNKSNRD